MRCNRLKPDSMPLAADAQQHTSDPGPTQGQPFEWPFRVVGEREREREGEEEREREGVQ